MLSVAGGAGVGAEASGVGPEQLLGGLEGLLIDQGRMPAGDYQSLSFVRCPTKCSHIDGVFQDVLDPAGVQNIPAVGQ